MDFLILFRVLHGLRISDSRFKYWLSYISSRTFLCFQIFQI